MAKNRIAFKGDTKLEAWVIRWANRRAEGYENGVAGVFADLAKGGCESGYVGELIYNADCDKFFKRHAKDINEVLAGYLADSGQILPAMLGDKWDAEDPLCLESPNRTYCVWAAVEIVAARVAEVHADEAKAE